MPTIVWADTTAMILLTYLFPLLTREWVDTSNADLMGLDEARRQCGMQQAGSQAVRGRQDNRTGNTVRSNLPRKINIFNFETCSGQTWLSSTLPLSISSAVHLSFPKVFTSFNFSFLRTSAWTLAVPLYR